MTYFETDSVTFSTVSSLSRRRTFGTGLFLPVPVITVLRPVDLAPDVHVEPRHEGFEELPIGPGGLIDHPIEAGTTRLPLVSGLVSERVQDLLLPHGPPETSGPCWRHEVRGRCGHQAWSCEVDVGQRLF